MDAIITTMFQWKSDLDMERKRHFEICGYPEHLEQKHGYSGSLDCIEEYLILCMYQQ